MGMKNERIHKENEGSGGPGKFSPEKSQKMDLNFTSAWGGQMKEFIWKISDSGSPGKFSQKRFAENGLKFYLSMGRKNEGK